VNTLVTNRLIKRVFLGLLVFVLLGVAALALSYFRPWATYRPSTMNSMFKPENRVEFFRNMDRVFPKRNIAASSAPVPFAQGTAIALPTSFTHAGANENAQAFLDRSDTTSLFVLKNGKIVYENYFKGATRDSRFTSWSVAKTFVGTLAGIAHAEGKIKSLDDRAVIYLPELQGKEYGNSTIRSLLQMASGVQFDETYHHPLSDINWFFYRTFILGQRADRVVQARERYAPPSSEFHYISSDTQLLGAIVARVYAKPLAKVLEEKLWQPLGMEQSAFWSIDRDRDDGQEIGFCCLNATARDFAKLGQLYLQDGQWHGKQVLSPKWVALATRPTESWQQPDENDPDDLGYAFKWWIPGWKKGEQQTEFLARGVWQHIYVNTAKQVVIVRTSVDPQANANTTRSLSLYRAIANAGM
jgi:CubicO group peptidase (beta-lactamase class C family)